MSKPIRKLVENSPKIKKEKKINVKSLTEKKELYIEILKKNRHLDITTVHKIYDKLKDLSFEAFKKIIQNLNVDLILLIHPSVLKILSEFNYKKISLFNLLNKRVIFNLSGVIDKIKSLDVKKIFIEKIAGIAFYSPYIITKLNNMKPSNLRRLFLEFDFMAIPKICCIPENIFESSQIVDLKRASVLDYDTMVTLNKEKLAKINSLSDNCLKNLESYVLSNYLNGNEVIAVLLEINNNKSIEKLSNLRPNYLRYIVQFNMINLEYLGRRSIFVLKRLVEDLNSRKLNYIEIQNMSFSELTALVAKLENFQEKQVNNGN